VMSGTIFAFSNDMDNILNDEKAISAISRIAALSNDSNKPLAVTSNDSFNPIIEDPTVTAFPTTTENNNNGYNGNNGYESNDVPAKTATPTPVIEQEKVILPVNENQKTNY